MKELNVKIVELLQLEAELNGVRNQEGETVFNGLLSLKLPLVAKYWVNELNETVSKEKKKVDDLRTELVKKYGREVEGGNLIIDLYLDEEKKEPNPAYAEFQREYSELLEQEKSVSFSPVKLSLLEKVESGENYPVFFRFVEP